MAVLEVIRLPRSITQRLRQRAERQGMGLEEYLVEIATQGLDPPKRALEYIWAARGLLEQAREELKEGDAGQAAEKTWGATALAVKAYAAWREGKRLTSHGELWKYTLVLRRELGEYAADAWAHATAMHVCFYEGWCSKEHVKDAIEKIEKLLRAIEEKLGRTIQDSSKE